MSALLDDRAIAALFASLELRRGLLVGVSGGPDSMALLRLLSKWGRAPIHAATVDHGLRADSRGEAELVAGWTTALGIPHAILTWQGDKPSTRLQERAREARYALLDAHAGEIGADTLLTAHHADDQAETILFRLTRGSGVAGLAGMAREARRGQLFHARPLLDLAKADLISVCEALGQDFIRDPSNENKRFARAGLRALAGTLEQQGLGRAELLRLGRRAARADEALAALAADLSRRIDARRTGDTFAGDIGALRGAPLELIIRLLSAEVARVAGERPRYDRAEALAERLREALAEGGELRATLGGALVRLGRGGQLKIAPERPRGKDNADKTLKI